jgi:carboxyl-terminal processing protease
MSRRNLAIVLFLSLVSTLCSWRADRNRYGRYLAQVLDAIDQWWLYRPEPRELFESAMRGITGSLDQYSEYIRAEDAAVFEADVQQRFGGIGVRIGLEGEPRRLIVISPPLFDTPAMKAGIRVRDQIVSIDGQSTAGITMDQVVQRLRGPVGDSVQLTILHQGETEPVTLTLVRETIRMPSVLGDRRREDGSWDYLLTQDPRIAYLRILSFGEQTAEEVAGALETLRTQGAQALIVDLRDNAGGLLDSAVDTCDLFLPAGLSVVTIRGRNPRLDETWVSDGSGSCLDMPVVVLVNRYSASASEIVAACLQDHRRSEIVGERTWGKGTVQHVIPIEAGRSRLKLTAASYWRPSGENIHRLSDDPAALWGVTPDTGCQLSLSDDEEQTRRDDRARRDLDIAKRPGDAPHGTVGPVDRQLLMALERIQPRLDRLQ